jgi:hypothetical protein
VALDLQAVRRFGRQIALAEFGGDGQARVLAAEVALAGDGVALETVARYLGGAGVPRFRVLSRAGGEAVRAAAGAVGATAQVQAWPTDGAAWQEALAGCALVVRLGLDDDAMVRAAVRLGIPAVAMRVQPDEATVLSLRQHGPCPHQELELPGVAGDATNDGAAAVVAGTLAASEALLRLAQPAEPPRARLLRLPLGGGEPIAAEIPWSPECFLCGGHVRELVTR